MLRVFISHSSQNAWAIHGLIDLILAVQPQADVFCSTEIPIQPGDNYKDVIYTNLRDADVFVAIVSREYWESKFCILELGAAYQRYCFDESKPVSIQPMLLPPLDKGLALANTPLVEMQLADLTDPQALALFLRKIAGNDAAAAVDQLEPRIARYAATVHKSVLTQTSLMAEAEVGAYFDERPENQVPRERIVRCQDVGTEGYRFEFWLSRLPYEPSFASVALDYWNEVNFREYLSFDRDATFCTRIDNEDGALAAVTVEFKVGESHRVYRAIDCELAQGPNEISIPLAPLDKKPLGEINQICFVVHPQTMHDLDGEVLISDVRVAFGERNLLEETS